MNLDTMHGRRPERAQLSRLTVGWQETGRAATLRQHAATYGPMPQITGRSTHGLIEQVAAAPNKKEAQP